MWKNELEIRYQYPFSFQYSKSVLPDNIPSKIWKTCLNTFKMVFFNSLRNYLRIFGYFQQNSRRSEQIICKTLICTILIILEFSFISVMSYFINEAKTFREYADSFLYVSYSFLMLAWCISFPWNKANFSKIIDNIEIVIEKSE